MSEEFDAASYYTALYALISFLLVMLVVMLLYVACSKRYRLNWFERNLLEQAETKEMTQSQEALVGVESQAGSSRTLNRSPSEDKFWVPPNLQRQTSVCQSDPQDTSGDESAPGTPNTPLGIKVSPFAVQQIVVPSSEKALSPLARGEKHAVQPSTSNSSSSSSSRPRVSSMHTKLDHTKIDTSMYQKAPPSRTPSQQEDLRGSIRLRLAYDPAAGILTIRLIEAHDLQPKDFSGTADPYAKIRLLPDRTNVWQTRIHKKTLNPVFDEDFVFEVKPTALPRRILEILLYDFDAYSRHHSIGGVQLPLAHIDLTEKVTMWKGLGPGSEHDAKVELGELMVSLAYLPSAERLTVVVLKARNLRVVDESRTASDPYIKVSLMQNGKRVKKKKTSVARNTVNPVFNEAITFSVVREQLKISTLEFCVMNDSILGQNDVLGQVLIGPDCKGEELEFFQEILTSKTAVAQWLVLGDAE